MQKTFKFNDGTEITVKVKKNYKDFKSGLPDKVLNYLISNPGVSLV